MPRPARSPCCCQWRCQKLPRKQHATRTAFASPYTNPYAVLMARHMVTRAKQVGVLMFPPQQVSPLTRRNMCCIAGMCLSDTFVIYERSLRLHTTVTGCSSVPIAYPGECGSSGASAAPLPAADTTSQPNVAVRGFSSVQPSSSSTGATTALNALADDRCVCPRIYLPVCKSTGGVGYWHCRLSDN